MIASCNFCYRQHAQIRQICEKVKSNTCERAKTEGKKDISSRIANFSSNEAHLHPSIESQQARDQSGPEATNGESWSNWSRRSFSSVPQESSANDDYETRYFRARKCILDSSAHFHSTVINGSEGRDHSNSKQPLGHGREGMEI